MKIIFSFFAALFFLNTLTAQVNAGLLISTVPAGHHSAYPYDFDSDGDMDIISTNSEFAYSSNYYLQRPLFASEFAWYENTGSLPFTQHDLSDLTMPLADIMELGDLNNDGIADLVYQDGWQLKIRYSVAMDTYAPATVLYDFLEGFDAVMIPECIDQNPYGMPIQWVMRLFVNDVNEDGINDLIVVSRGRLNANDPISCWQGLAYCMYGDGTQLGAPQYLFPMETVVGLPGYEDILFMDAKDYNADGFKDIYYYRNEGNGYEHFMIYGSASGFAQTGEFLSTHWLSDFSDMDLDGDLDITTILSNYGYVDTPYGEFSYNTLIDDYGVEAAGIVTTDFNGDQLPDVAVMTSLGYIRFFMQQSWGWPEGTTGSLSHNFLMDTDLTGTVYQYQKMDIDGNGTDDIMCITADGLYVFTTNSSEGSCTININPFLDLNTNGLDDVDEPTPVISPLHLIGANGATTYYSPNGTLSILVDPGTFQLTYMDNNVYNNPLFAFSQSVNCPAANDVVEVLLPFEIQGTPEPMAEVSFHHWFGMCNSPIPAIHELVVTNIGSSAFTGDLRFGIDNHLTFLSANPVETSIDGNEIHWDVTDLGIGETLVVYVYTTTYLTADMNELTNYGLYLDVIDEYGNPYDNQRNERTHITCAYDPNDITEHSGYTDLGYFAEGQVLDYTIRFQNTGNASATIVRIENQLPAELDWSSLVITSASHPFVASMDEDGLLTVLYDNIMLPDSASDLEGSNGYVHYRVNTLPNLATGTQIANLAGIVFDLNDAVITNTAINTKYDCSDLDNVTAITTSYCDDDDVFTIGNNAEWIENITWTYNGNEATTSSADFTVGSGGTIEMIVSNDLCDLQQTWAIENNEASIPQFTATGNTISTTASGDLQWYLNGNAIDGATSSTYEMAQSGNYSVEVTNADGCSAISAQQALTYTGVNENVIDELQVYPNPASDFVTVLTSTPTTIRIVDVTGKTCLTSASNRLQHHIDISELSAGVYQIVCDGGKKTLIVR
jgi:uncharacterized repeat protein (TIGR01451 family)